MTIEEQKILWEAVNKYAAARGADMSRTSVDIQLAVVEVNNAVEKICTKPVRKRPKPPPTPAPFGPKLI